MSAFLAFVGGAAGEWNKMSEEKRASAAAKAKADAELAAEIAKENREWDTWKKQQEFLNARADEEIKNEATRKNTERAEQAARITPELLSKQQQLPGQLHFLSYATESTMPVIESVDKPVEGYTFDEAIGVASQYNPRVKDQGVFYAVKPLADNPERFTIDLRDINEENKTTNVFADQAEAQSAAQAETDRLKESGATNLRAVALPTTDGEGWTYKIEKIGDLDGGKAEIPADEQGIEYNTNYYFRTSPKFGPETGKTAQQRGGQILNLTPGLNLPTSGEGMAQYVEDQDFVLIRRPMGPEGSEQRAGQDMTFFFADFTPEIVDKLIAGKDDPFVRRSYGIFKDRISEVLTNWTLGTADEIPEGRQLMPLPMEFQERLQEMAEKDPSIRQILRNHPNDGAAETLNQQVGNPINEPIAAFGSRPGGAAVYRNQNFADAFAVEGEDGVVRYPQAVQEQVLSIARNAQQEPAYVHRFFDQATEPNGESSPEATQGAFYGTLQNKEILGNYSFRTVRGNRAQYTMPSVIEVGDIQDNLSYFQTDTQRIDALTLAVPSLAARQAHASAQVSASSGPAALYESVTGNTDYDKLQARLENAQRIKSIDAELQTLLGPLQGEVSLPNQITLLKKGANYLLTSVMSTVRGGEGVDMNEVRSGLQAELEAATSTGDLEAQVAALVRLNTKMQSYAYASMMDPNGRLSDQDRQQAEVATGSEGLTATKDTVLAVSSRLSSAADRVTASINGYRSNDPRRVVATHLYTTQIAGGMATNVVQFLGITGTQEASQQGTTGGTGEGSVQNNLEIINRSLGTSDAVNTEDEDERI